MPRGDGTGPARNNSGGRGRMKGPFSAGPGGNCICPACGTTLPHIQGQPCSQRSCPKCGRRMTRQ
ncbi:MAG: hypothetical protein PHH77_06055 [Victivallaceae bacterium]|nr:hypothetical protein [Victivallaceae bacterium]